MRLFASLLAIAALFCASSASASELTILDCKGSVKALENIDGDTLSSLEVLIENSSTDALTLSSKTGNEVTASVKKDTATFSSVSPGTWTLCDSEKEYVAFSISKISQGTLATGNQVSSAILGGSAIAAVSAAALTLGGSSSGSGDGSSLTGGFDGSLVESEEAVAPLPDPAVSFDEADFPVGAPAKPVSPFN